MKSLTEQIEIFINYKINDVTHKYNKLEISRNEFITKFPKNQLENMLIDDYVVGSGKESFCYWIETKLRALGSIKGGSPADKKFGLYFNKEEGVYKTLSKWDASLNPERAFNNIKIAIKNLLIAAEEDDSEAVSNNPLSPMFKNKILTIYYPDKYLNIFSETHVDYFLRKLGIKNASNYNVEDKRKQLLKYKMEHLELKSLNNYMFSVFLYDWSNPKTTEIRILQMSSKVEFPNISYQEIQEKFFLGSLKNEKNGYYNFRSSGINTSTGTLILFQIDNAIIASAKLKEIVKYEKPLDGIYNGTFLFDKETIKVFEPIVSSELNRIDNSFKTFSQVKQKLDSNKYEEILALIDSKSKVVFLPEEIPNEKVDMYTEGSKKLITVNAYERNPKARQSCIEIHGTSCIICGFNFSDVYGEEFAGKIHVHHLKPLHEIDEKYEVNPEKDMVPVCPNCHMILHSKLGGGTNSIEEVKSFLLNKRLSE